jgi:protocatechuate 3,4-dioxygenase alpha subunit
MAPEGGQGERIRLSLRVLDGAGAPASGDAMIELWEPEAGFGRLETGVEGTCVFETIKVPFFSVAIFARGLLKQLWTRLYFDGDKVPDMVPAGRRDTLVARRREPGWWHLDIRLQGEGETVFFDM